MRVMIVDDEKPARDRLQRMLQKIPRIEVIGEAGDGRTALAKVVERRPDLLLLDVQMPGLGGFEVIQGLLKQDTDLPHIIFVTAYDEYALRAFEVEAIDYLLKPVEQERLEQAINRVDRIADRHGLADRIIRLTQILETQNNAPLEKIAVRKRQKIVLIDIGNIHWVEADAGLTFIHTDKERFLVNSTLRELEDRLPKRIFFRSHRSSLVNLEKILEIIPKENNTFCLRLDDAKQTQVPISRGQVTRLRDRLRF